MSLSDIRHAIAAAVDTTGMQAQAYPTGHVPDLPLAIVGPPERIAFDSDLGGGKTITLPVTVFCTAADLSDGGEALDDIIDGLDNVKDAIELAAVGHAIRVVEARPVELTTYAQGEYLTSQLIVEVIT